ncbi:MAG: hypothetical protein AAF432_11765 [Planctomycetota bacterium]
MVLRKMFIPAVVMVLCLVTGVTRGDNQNAAWWYGRAIESMESLTADDWSVIHNYVGEIDAPITPELRAVLNRANTVINEARRGSNLATSDFGLDYSEGFEMMLPHLSELRQVARLMRVDAQVRLVDGDSAGAADRIAAMYRIGEHVGQDGTVVSSLVGNAIFSFGDGFVDVMVDQGGLDAATSAALASALGDVDPRDPFHYVDAVAMEQELAITSLDRMFSETGDVTSILEMMTLEGELRDELQSMTREDFDAQLGQYDGLMTEMVELFASPDSEAAQERLAEIDAEIEAGEHGALAMAVMPALTKVYDQKLRSEDMVRSRIEMLQSISDGSIDILEEANAARWYVKAANKLQKREPEVLDALRAMDMNASRAIDPLLVTMYEKSSEIDALVEQGTRMRRCDFRPLRQLESKRPVGIAVYSGPIRDLSRYLIVDAIRAIRARDNELMAQRLREAIVLSAHLASDGTYASSMTSHHVFLQVTDLGREAFELQVIDRDELRGLLAMARRISAVDPFGYVGTSVGMKAAFLEFYDGTIAPDVTDRDALLSRLKSMIERYRADDLLHVGLIVEAMVQTSAPMPASLDVATAGLLDLMDLREVDSARQRLPEDAPLIAMYDLPTLRDVTRPNPAGLYERMRNARRDLRGGLRKLDPDETLVPASRMRQRR